MSTARWLACAPLLLLCGCHGAPAPAARTCEVRGEIVRLDAQVRTAVIKHQKICDWMEAMTMEFPVRDAQGFAALKPGDKVVATVHIGDPEFWLTGIHAAP